jgi:hypothetical protein
MLKSYKAFRKRQALKLFTPSLCGSVMLECYIRIGEVMQQHMYMDEDRNYNAKYVPEELQVLK